MRETMAHGPLRAAAAGYSPREISRIFAPPRSRAYTAFMVMVGRQVVRTPNAVSDATATDGRERT